ncbi:GNAT family protein [Paenibacillus sp. JCM 10914]|uniref:GNAT family N-acetyltransferase n=1 Tax=Paenibacillus sp. JCM 10914 TaxID=1236974 RepID=UPI0003CC7BF2|nr:GNAT family protein [Paenibacillus sp. JCM 10914]GAE07426.1 ribosomal-protein-S5p-alanine acetyltransferase [Paenibacillus sp. JCM 10914]
MTKWLETQIEGNGIRLRPVREDELEVYYALLLDPESNRLTGTQQEISKESVAAWIQNIRMEHADRVDMMIAVEATDELIGEVVLNEIDSVNRSANIRILISNQHSNRGFGTEAIKLMLQHGFEQVGLHRIELGVYEFNPRAIHVYEKIGFKREGILRDALYWNGEFHDMIMMSMIEDEYRLMSAVYWPLDHR